MTGYSRILFLLASALLFTSGRPLFSQLSTVYTTVHSTKTFVVGGQNATTGLFYQRVPGDTLWEHSGWNNIHAFGLAVDPESRGELLAIGAGNGVHITSDGGKAWKIITGWNITEVLCVVIDRHDKKRMFCTTPYGIYRTDDGGKAWKEVSRGLSTKFVSSLIIDHSKAGTLYCSTEKGVYKSTDGATNWKKTGLKLSGIRCISQNPKDSRILAAGTEDNGIYLSRDSGNNWERCRNGIDHTTFYTIAFDPKNPEKIYAGGFETGVYKSTDGGLTWIRSEKGLASLKIHSISVDPANTDRIYAGTLGRGVYRSLDGGITWEYAGLEGSHVWNVSIQPF